MSRERSCGGTPQWRHCSQAYSSALTSTQRSNERLTNAHRAWTEERREQAGREATRTKQSKKQQSACAASRLSCNTKRNENSHNSMFSKLIIASYSSSLVVSDETVLMQTLWSSKQCIFSLAQDGLEGSLAFLFLLSFGPLFLLVQRQRGLSQPTSIAIGRQLRELAGGESREVEHARED